MSYILDALRKSETERSLGDYAPAKDPAFDITDRAPSRLRGAAIVAVIGATAGLTLFWLFQGPAGTIATPTTAVPPSGSVKSSAVAANSTLPPGQAGQLSRETAVPSTSTRKQSSSSTARVAPPANSAAAANGDSVKFLRAMPSSFRSRLPKLEINIHVYSPDLTQQILYVNNHEVKPGQRVDGGAILESITPDGAILRLDDTRFKLPRPS